MPRDEVFDPITLLPEWVKKEKELAHMHRKRPVVTLPGCNSTASARLAC